MKAKGLLALLIFPAMALQAAESAADRLADAVDVFSEIMATPDKGIPQDLLEKSQCVAIVPGLKKGAFVIGGEFGKGFVECRNTSGPGWGPPAAVRVEGGSVGFQIGGSATDVVMLVMNKRGMDKLMTNKFTLGADASVAAGPVGRTADAKTDAYMTAEILAWSRAKGLFAGVSLSGATLRNDLDGNKELYGSRLTNKEVLGGGKEAPEAAKKLIAALDKYSMRKEN
jgi:lipid-binding SYLF domain-containing protein